MTYNRHYYVTDVHKIETYRVERFERTDGPNVNHYSKSGMMPLWFNRLVKDADLVEIDPSEYRTAGTVIYKVWLGAEYGPTFYTGKKVDF